MGAPHDLNAQRLQTDRGLFRWKLVAGVASVAVLVGLFATSLFRAPNPVFSILVAVATVLLVLVMAWGVVRRRRPRVPRNRCG